MAYWTDGLTKTCITSHCAAFLPCQRDQCVKRVHKSTSPLLPAAALVFCPFRPRAGLAGGCKAERCRPCLGRRGPRGQKGGRSPGRLLGADVDGPSSVVAKREQEPYYLHSGRYIHCIPCLLHATTEKPTAQSHLAGPHVDVALLAGSTWELRVACLVPKLQPHLRSDDGKVVRGRQWERHATHEHNARDQNMRITWRCSTLLAALPQRDHMLGWGLPASCSTCAV